MAETSAPPSSESSASETLLDVGQSWPRDTSSPRLSRKARDDAVAVNETSVDDPDNYPLNSPWTFWHDMTPRGSTAKDYFANLKPLCTVKTIKAFWGVVNNIRPVHDLGERESYHLMRNENRRPIWEDEANAHGGLWSFKVAKIHTADVWQELLLAAVGEQFTDCVAAGDCVCGISVRIRGFDQNTVQIWNEDSELHSKATVIQKVKELIPKIEINEFYQSNRAKMREESLKSAVNYRPSTHWPPRYPGAPPPAAHGMYPYPPPPGMYQPRYRQFSPRQFRPPHPS